MTKTTKKQDKTSAITKENKRLLIIFGSITALFVIAIISLAITGLTKGIFNRKTEVIEEKSFDNIGNIEIDAKVGDIKIITVNPDITAKLERPTVKIIGEKDNSEVKISQDTSNNLTLTADGEQFCFIFCFYTKGADIEITVPENYDKNINIKNEIGDIKIDRAQAISIKNNVGNIDISKVLKSLQIENNVGEITIDDVIIEVNSEIKNNVGEIKIKKISSAVIEANTDIGQTNVRNDFDASSAKLKVENNIGSIDISN